MQDNENYVNKLIQNIKYSHLDKKKQKFNIITKTNILNIKSENKQYYLHTKSILENSEYCYSGILTNIRKYKLDLVEFVDRIKHITETQNTQNMIKKEYDDIVLLLYNSIKQFFKLEILDANISTRAIFDLSDNNVTRNVGLIYLTSDGIVINDNIAIIDNILLEISDNKLTITVGKFTYNFYKSNLISPFSIHFCLDKISIYLNEINELEKQLEKNIIISDQAKDILDIIKKF
jgi:hypothetical protein